MSEEDKPLLSAEQLQSAIDLATGVKATEEAFDDAGSFSYKKTLNLKDAGLALNLSIAMKQKGAKNFHGN